MFREKKYFEDPSVLHLGTEENRSYYIPFAPGDEPGVGSSRVIPLDGEWQFKYYDSVYDGAERLAEPRLRPPPVHQRQLSLPL